MIKIRYLWFVVLVVGLPSTARPDVVTLRNGDRLTGTVVRKTGEELRFKSTAGDVVGFPWHEVLELHADQPVNLRMKNGKSVQGPVILRADPAAATTNDVSAVVDIDRVATINSRDESAWRSEGLIALSAKIERGNAQLDDVDLTVRVSLRDPNNRISLNGEVEREVSEGLDTKHKWFARTRYDRFFTKKSYSVTEFSSEGNEFAELDLRSWIALGVGHDTHDDRAFEAGGRVMLLRVYDEHKTKDDSEYWGTGFAVDLEKKLFNSQLRYYLHGSVYMDIEETNRFFVDAWTGVRVPLWDRIVGTTEVKIEHDNVPSEGAEKTDYTYRLKVGYQW
jgi:hypothetical protein